MSDFPGLSEKDAELLRQREESSSRKRRGRGVVGVVGVEASGSPGSCRATAASAARGARRAGTLRSSTDRERPLARGTGTGAFAPCVEGRTPRSGGALRTDVELTRWRCLRSETGCPEPTLRDPAGSAARGVLPALAAHVSRIRFLRRLALRGRFVQRIVYDRKTSAENTSRMCILDPDDLSGLSQRQIPNQFLTSQSNDDEPVDPTLSPSGLKIAYSDSGRIWTINVYEGSGRRRITNLDDCYQPSWSPDSSRIAFRKTKSSLDVHAGIWIINADGTGLTSFSGSAYARSPGVVAGR